MFGARIATLARDGIEQARIALNPAEMGPVSVQLELSGTQVRVELAAEVEATRVALEQALPALAGSLREAGFTLAGGGVFQQARGDASGQGSEQDGSFGTGSRALGDQPGLVLDGNPSARAGGRAPRGLVDLYA
jgi:flagellar hook-length control protein FliK